MNKKDLSVLYIIDGIGPSAARGVEVVYDNIRLISKLGVVLTLLTTIDSYTDKAKWNEWRKHEMSKNTNIRIVAVDWSWISQRYFAVWFSKFLTFVRAVTLLQEKKYDIVHEYSSSPLMFLKTALLSWIGGTKSIHTILTYNTGILGKPFFSVFGNIINLCILPVESFREQYSPFVRARKLFVLPYGVNMLKYKSKSSRDNKFQLPENKTKILFLGPPEKEKGFHLFVNAASQILSSSKSFFFVAVVYRKKTEESFQKAMELANKKTKKYPQNFVVIEELVKVADLFSQIDVLVIPQITPHGTLVPPLTIIEGMAAQKIVIVSDQKEVKEIVIDKKNGLLFKNNSLVSFVEVLKKLNMKEKRLGYVARETINERFNDKVNVKKLRGLYTELLK